ncbi:MAG: tetratricopeptide repeat protein [Chloroflexota bacterium]
MNPHLLNITVGLLFIVVFGGLSFLRREGLSLQFALESLGVIAIIEAATLLTGIVINPIFFLMLIYLVSMRARLLVDLANLLSARGRQRDAVKLLQLALRLFPERNTRLIVLVSMGIIQLRRKNPESAQSLLESVLEEAADGGLSMKSESACYYNLGLALQRQGEEAKAIHHFNKAIDAFPTSIYGKAAGRALEQWRSGQHKATEKSPGEAE